VRLVVGAEVLDGEVVHDEAERDPPRLVAVKAQQSKICALECRDIDILRLFFWSADHLSLTQKPERERASDNFFPPHLLFLGGTVLPQGRGLLSNIKTKCMVELLLR
jgi:hypothetical protein